MSIRLAWYRLIVNRTVCCDGYVGYFTLCGSWWLFNPTLLDLSLASQIIFAMMDLCTKD